MEQESTPQTDTVTAGGVWPPPPMGSPPVPAVLIPTFAPVGRLARTILVLLGLYAASAVVGLAYAHVPAAGRQIEVCQVARRFLTQVSVRRSLYDAK